MVTAVVGAGGKTSYIHKKSKEYMDMHMRVFVTTTTHMFIENDTLITDDSSAIEEELCHRSYCMAGTKGPEGKISRLSYDTYLKACSYADIVLVEADGSRHMPLKYPAEWEPEIPDNVDKIVIVMGLHGIGKKCSDAVQRHELAEKALGITAETVIEKQHVDEIIRKGYLEPLKKKYPDTLTEVFYSNYGSRTMSL